jgi:hypothetical protein
MRDMERGIGLHAVSMRNERGAEENEKKRYAKKSG